jgi:hypothetical protein
MSSAEAEEDRRQDYDHLMREPCPVIPEELRRTERTVLKAIVPPGGFPCPVHVIVAYVGVINAVLQEDGTFSYNDREKGLNSFELLWHLKQHGIRLFTRGMIDRLGPMMAKDSHFALRYIYSHSAICLAEKVEEFYREMPALTPVPESYEAIKKRLTAKEKELLAEIKELEEIQYMKGLVRALEKRRDELKAVCSE